MWCEYRPIAVGLMSVLRNIKAARGKKEAYTLRKEGRKMGKEVRKKREEEE